jgi:hypothetical protein
MPVMSDSGHGDAPRDIDLGAQAGGTRDEMLTLVVRDHARGYAHGPVERLSA